MSTRSAPLDELLGAYAVHALADDELAAVEAYLAATPLAREEADRLNAVAAELGSWEEEIAPPPHVWDGLLARLASSPASAADGRRGATPLPPLHLLPGPRSQRRRAAPRWLAAAAAVVAAALLVGGGFWAGRSSDAGRSSLSQLAEQASATPGSLRGDLRDEGGSPRARAVVTASGDGYLVASGLPELAAGQTYQLWSLDGPQPVSLAVVGQRPEVVGFPAAAKPRSLAITIEPTPGVATPTQSPLVSGLLA